jgi:hypothetical protein
MVSIMDDRARAIFDEARETLARTADVKVERRVHDDDGFLSPWSRTMPKKPAPPTMAEVEQKIADLKAELARMIDERAHQPRALDVAEIEALVGGRLLTSKAIAPVLIELREQLRKEIAKARPAEEFFYTDDDSADGVKRDADLHGPILRAVDYPIDEKIMGPIRAKHRAKYLAEQRDKRARSARVIDLPALPLRGRHG